MGKAYVIAGPADAGNVFGFFKPGLVPAGSFIVAEHGEYANGGHGPSTVDGKEYATAEAAKAIADRINAETEAAYLATLADPKAYLECRRINAEYAASRRTVAVE